jgi:glc operon protein GlcG
MIACDRAPSDFRRSAPTVKHREIPAMPNFVATHRITHEATMLMLQRGIAKAIELNALVSIAVVDAGGQTLAFVRMDGARLFSETATIKKAKTASSQGRATGYAKPEDVVSMQIRFGGHFTNVPGGLPIVVDGQVIGGIGAGGAKIEQDVEIAKAALAALDD